MISHLSNTDPFGGALHTKAHTRKQHHSPESNWHRGPPSGTGRREPALLPEHGLGTWSSTDLLFPTIKGFRDYTERSK